eukprot:TRINITY_DN8701_c0_g2_i1.p1 TRINITY_DN8701_c0_g2~~TRINITY_DN8701_c0_g2_i1.p1  ORF type:complete len:619 (+),score=114.42 TRINITY_DN8701_c0_g2_i1:258-2114(+)
MILSGRTSLLRSLRSMASEVSRLRGYEDGYKSSVAAVFGDENVVLTVRHGGGKPLGFQRGKDETVGETLRRVGKKLEVPLLGEKPKKKGGPIDKSAPPPRLELIPEGADSEQPNSAAWPTTKSILIKSLEDDGKTWTIPVIFNPPDATEVTIEPTPYAGVVQVPTWSGTEDAEVMWFALPAPEEDPNPKKKKKQAPQPSVEMLDGAKYLHSGPSYTPADEVVGEVLAAVVIPRVKDTFGLPVVALSQNPVKGFKPYPEDKHVKFPGLPVDADTTRVLTYNILYDGATVIYKTGASMYPYANPEILDQDYRKQLFMKEVSGFHPDVVALQEVAGSLHDKYLIPNLKVLGFDGEFLSKTGDTREGVSLFWRTERFAKVAVHKINLGGETIMEEIKNRAGLEPLIEYCNKDGNEKVKKVWEKTTTVALVVVLEDIKGRKIVIGNTHLWFHPKGGHIRVLQLHVLFNFMKEVGGAIGGDVGYVVCGDLNCQPTSSPHVYMTEGGVQADHPVWSAAPLMDWADFRWEFEGEVVAAKESSAGLPPALGPHLTHPLHLADATPHITHSNYTPGFTGRLDYILHSPGLTPTSYHPIPPDEVLGMETGIPSSFFPSDHLPICVDLKQ